MEKLEYFIESNIVSRFVMHLRNANCTWNNIFESAERYDYNKFSQKPSDGLEKYQTIFKGNKIIFSAKPNSNGYDFMLEISYDDEPTSIYEIPYVNDLKVQSDLNYLLDLIHKQHQQKYNKMEAKLFSCFPR